jgi:hypothetical protein
MSKDDDNKPTDVDELKLRLRQLELGLDQIEAHQAERRANSYHTMLLVVGGVIGFALALGLTAR